MISSLTRYAMFLNRHICLSWLIPIFKLRLALGHPLRNIQYHFSSGTELLYQPWMPSSKCCVTCCQIPRFPDWIFVRSLKQFCLVESQLVPGGASCWLKILATLCNLFNACYSQSILCLVSQQTSESDAKVFSLNPHQGAQPTVSGRVSGSFRRRLME